MKNFVNQTLIVPFDFSEPALDTIEQVLQWSDPTSSIYIIFVVEPTFGFLSFDPALPIPPTFDVETHKRALKRMEELFGEGKYSRMKIHCEIGDPGSEIVALANEVRANMIIMPSHGRTGLPRLFLGSVAERVLRLASCPVLILRGESIERKGPKTEQESDAGQAETAT